MQFHSNPFRFGVFQLLVACIVVIFLTSPGEAIGPMLVIKGGHGHGGGGGGAGAILAAGLVIKLLQHLKKHRGGFAGGYEGGQGYSGGEGGGHGYSGGEGGGHGISIAGYTLGGDDGHMGGYGGGGQGISIAGYTLGGDGGHMGGYGGGRMGGAMMGGYGGGGMMGGYGGGGMMGGYEGGVMGGQMGAYSFENRQDQHAQDYGYEAQGYSWAK